jgi:hypothetical protein
VSTFRSAHNPSDKYLYGFAISSFLSLYNFDGLVKSRKTPFFVIPAEAGNQSNQVVLDPGVRRGDGLVDFLRSRQLSHRLQIYAYYAYVLACALKNNCLLISLDSRLVETAQKTGVEVLEVTQ